MTRVGCCALLLLLSVWPLAAAETLTYHGRVGRLVEYRLTFTATGQQISLGVSKPIQVEAEYVLREQVLSVEPDGSLFLQLSGRVTKWEDRTGLFNGQRADLPPTQVHLSPRGEVLEATPVTTGGDPDLRARTAAALFSYPLPTLLPEGPIEIGATWEWEKAGATQSSRLAAVEEGVPRVARITTTGQAPIALHEASEPLGLTTGVTGRETQSGTLEFSPERGLALWHKGKADLETKTEVGLDAPGGARTFTMSLKARVTFLLTLIRVDGKPVPRSSGERHRMISGGDLMQARAARLAGRRLRVPRLRRRLLDHHLLDRPPPLRTRGRGPALGARGGHGLRRGLHGTEQPRRPRAARSGGGRADLLDLSLLQGRGAPAEPPLR